MVKKQKVIYLDNEQQNKQDFDAIHKLQEELTKIDEFSIYTPDLQWFEQMVIQEQQKAKKKWRKELSFFMIIAFVILSGMIITIYQLPVLFMLLQIITTIFIAVYTSVRPLKKANHYE